MQRSDTRTRKIGTTTDAVDLNAMARRAPATDDLLQLNDWLAAHGAAHLSAIERIELAERLITRRRFLIGAGALASASSPAVGRRRRLLRPRPRWVQRGRLHMQWATQKCLSSRSVSSSYTRVSPK